MDSSLAVIVILQVTASVYAAVDTSYPPASMYSKYYPSPPSSYSYQPSQYPSSPASYSYSPSASYSYNQPASYSYSPPASSPKPASYPSSYGQSPSYSPLAYNQGYQPSAYYLNNQVPAYIPNSPLYQALGYSSGYGPYGSYPLNSNEYGNCTDQTCPANQCCEFNGRRYVCVPQATGASVPTPGAVCVRFKRCYSNGDCPASHCCVQRLDILGNMANGYNNNNGGSYNNYGGNYNNYGGGYNSYGGYGYGNPKVERGECVLSAANDAVCRRPVEGSATSNCPCATAGKVCIFSADNPLVGTCSNPPSK
ncbi:adhesive plaque matrix protein [Biomphalaria pfeifferi]|uniref:Adhesive plaque matrix protein n=1 Tax=Biomphalaria pfeifferi TaxID=112525 RepID=A0AAD8AR73_BIOPF|nr:adhesive plaque matrix protein [Biomphalaria pfeifferi]